MNDSYIDVRVQDIQEMGCYRILKLALDSRPSSHLVDVDAHPDAHLDSWLPGQFIQLALSAADGSIVVKRPFSFANDPKSPIVELHYVLIPGGAMSTYLKELKKNDPLLISKKGYGMLTLQDIDSQKNKLIFAATTTGIAPLISMLRAGQLDTFSSVEVLYSAKNKDSLLYHQELQDAAETANNIVYKPIITDIGVTTTAKRIPYYLDDILSKNRESKPHLMLCGNPAMIESCLALAARHGFTMHRRRTPGDITCERYWLTQS